MMKLKQLLLLNTLLLITIIGVSYPQSAAALDGGKPVSVLRKVESYAVKDGVVYVAQNKTLSAIDPSTQKVLWKFKGRGNAAGTKIIIRDDVLYYQTSDAKGTSLYAISRPDQELLWEYRYVQDDQVRPRCFLDAARGIVAYEGNETFLRIFRAATGEILWSYNNYVYNVNVNPIEPMITDKYVIYGDTFSGLTVFESATGKKVFSKLYGSIQGFNYTGGVIFWWTLTGNKNSHLSLTNPAKPSVESLSLDFRNRIDTTLFSKRIMLFTSYDRGAIAALDLVTFEKKWEFVADEERTTSNVRSSIIYNNGVVYLAGLDNRIYALDFKTGKELWRRDIQGAAREMVLDGDKLYYLDAKNNLFFIFTH